MCELVVLQILDFDPEFLRDGDFAGHADRFIPAIQFEHDQLLASFHHHAVIGFPVFPPTREVALDGDWMCMADWREDVHSARHEPCSHTIYGAESLFSD